MSTEPHLRDNLGYIPTAEGAALRKRPRVRAGVSEGEGGNERDGADRQ